MAYLLFTLVVCVMLLGVQVALAAQDVNSFATVTAKLLLDAKALAEERRAVDQTTLDKLSSQVELMTQALEDEKKEDQQALDESFKLVVSTCAANESNMHIGKSVSEVDEACKDVLQCRNDALSIQATEQKACEDRDDFKAKAERWPDLHRCKKVEITRELWAGKLEDSMKLINNLDWCSKTYANLTKTAQELDDACDSLIGQNDDKQQDCEDKWNQLQTRTCDTNRHVEETCAAYESHCDKAMKTYDDLDASLKASSKHRVAAHRNMKMIECLVKELGQVPRPKDFIENCSKSDGHGIDYWGLTSQNPSLKQPCNLTAIQHVMSNYHELYWGATVVDFCFTAAEDYAIV